MQDPKDNERPLILCMAHLPPPVNGVTVMGELVVNSQLLQSSFRIEVLPLKSAASIADIGKFRPTKILQIVCHAWQLAGTCLLYRPALVYFTLTPNGMAFYRDLLYVAVMKLFRVRRLYHLHGKGIAQALTGLVTKVLYDWAFLGAEVILLSPSLYEDSALVVKRSQCHFLANGVADPWGEGNAEPINRAKVPRILFFSNLVVSKGLFILLEALGLLKERGIAFQASFAGAWESPSVEADFGKSVQKWGLQEMVTLCGPRYGADKRKTFSEADIMAFPTYNDTFPLVVIEAMSHGLPVVSTYEGAIPEIVVDGVTGYLVRPRDPQSLFERLALLLEDPQLRDRMGIAGRKRFCKHFTTAMFENNIATIFRKCLHGAALQP